LYNKYKNVLFQNEFPFMRQFRNINKLLSPAILKSIGPGLLMAGAAIGVSHLVQATRAGADYGFSLWWVLLLACLTKYPFLEFGPRYAAATGEHMIAGYWKMGKGAFQVFAFITLGTMFIIQAAVTIVTAGLAENLLGFGWSHVTWSAVIFLFCIFLLLVGRYPGLDKSMKVIILLLTSLTLAAVIIALGAGSMAKAASIPSPSWFHAAGLAFIIAFMGWMPIPLDASVWQSIWAREKAKQTGFNPGIREAAFDFRLGYFSSVFIGVLFFLLGIMIMYGSNSSFPSGSVAFSARLVDIYTQTLGNWSRPIISLAAFVTMFSTTLVVTDIYPRVIVELIKTGMRKELPQSSQDQAYRFLLFLIPAIALLILNSLKGSFTTLVDFAAGLSFVSAPLLGWYNLKLVTGPLMPVDARPGEEYMLMSRLSLVFLVLFSLVYIWWLFFL
jgi:Mn2+/Fe2+ NRAMP family transporter